MKGAITNPFSQEVFIYGNQAVKMTTRDLHVEHSLGYLMMFGYSVPNNVVPSKTPT